jgi:hypothetical protein
LRDSVYVLLEPRTWTVAPSASVLAEPAMA